MITTRQMAEAFDRNARVVRMQTEGLTHAESLIQTSFNINCLNWVVGHMVVYRDQILEFLGEAQLLSEDERGVYARESEPIREDGEGIVKLERLLKLLNSGQERIAAGLERLAPLDLERDIQVGTRMVSTAERLFFFYFHDTYHTGQTDLLRQVAGKDDKII